MRFTSIAAYILSLSVLLMFSQPTTASAAEDRSISGTVFFDTNKNGQLDFGELPAPGRTVELSRFDREPRHVASTKTDAEGHYRFDHIAPNFVVINVGVRTDAQTGCITGATQGVDNLNGGMLMGKTVAPGSIVDLGVLPMGDGAITGTFTNDLNENGVRDAGEAPLKGWKVTLQGLEIPNVVCYSESTTGSDGAFRIAVNVDWLNWLSVYPPPSIRDPWEWTAPTEDSGNASSPPDQQQRPDFVSEGDQLDVMIHFSTGSASLSGTVFRDLDGDGARDLMEPFVDCNHVEHLLQLSHKLSGVGAIEVNTTATCAPNGKFKFTHLEGGDYRIGILGSFSLPEYYHPWNGGWVTIANGEHSKDYVIALCPADKCPEPVPTAIPAPVRPVERKSPQLPIVVPIVGSGSGSDQSTPVSTAALLIAMTGLASICMATLIQTHRSRRI